MIFVFLPHPPFSQENYTFGTQFVAINISYIIGTPIAAYVYLPVFFRQENSLF